MQGFVVGFKGAQVFCLHFDSMQAIEVPQSASMQRYLAAEEWNSAYKVRSFCCRCLASQRGSAASALHKLWTKPAQLYSPIW